MSRHLSVSQLAEVTGLDRRTISKHLGDIPFKNGPGGAHLYYTPFVVPLLLHRSGMNVNWPLLIEEWLKGKRILGTQKEK